ncbi:MAG: hypothetical protein CL928_17085 [Deltaproteobacteria bacterium]|nr:hypothetical protein [Deltaproteobacteria bacterium]
MRASLRWRPRTMRFRRRNDRRPPGPMGGEEAPRWFSWQRQGHRVLRVGLALLTSVLLAALIVDWSPLDGVRGLEVGDILKTTVRARNPLEVVDESLTSERRRLAAERTANVFNYDVLLARNVQRRIDQAFEEMRAFLAAEKSMIQGSDEPGDPLPSDPVRLERQVERFATTLAVELRDTDVATLQFAGFSESTQRDVKELVRVAMGSYILLDRDHLPTQGPITVVRQEGVAREEIRLDQLDSVRDLQQARRLIARTASDDFRDRPAHVLETITHLAGELCAPNLHFEASETAVRKEQAAAAVPVVTRSYQQGQVIRRSGDEVDSWSLNVIQQMNAEARAYSPTRHLLALTMLFLVFSVLLAGFAERFISKFCSRIRDLIAMAILVVLVAAGAAILQRVGVGLSGDPGSIPLTAYGFAVPVAVGGIMLRTLMNSETAIVWSIYAALVCTVIMGGGVWLAVFYMVSCLVASGGVGRSSERGRIVRAGVVASLANVAVVIATEAVQYTGIAAEPWVSGGGLAGTSMHVLFALCGGLASGVLAVGLVPAFEAMGFVTDSRLLELSNLNHPLLRDMIVKAPGTYHHSIVVGSLAEAAAESIHANSLLVRVGAYFHDIGKMLKPQYYIENQRDDDNPHDRLTPSMSVLIITNHVKDGIELGRRYGLPQSIIDMIPQHHGTSRVEYFYNKAKGQEDPGKGEIGESDFRYPGPKPQTREAAIMMLADGVEAATRSLSNHSPGSIRSQVERIVNQVVRDGQLEECPLTLKDLHSVSETFIQVLLGIHHHRIEYPGPPVPGEGRSRGLPASSIKLEIPSHTPNPSGIHPLEIAAAEQSGTEIMPPSRSPEPQSEPEQGSDDFPEAEEGGDASEGDGSEEVAAEQVSDPNNEAGGGRD